MSEKKADTPVEGQQGSQPSTPSPTDTPAQKKGGEEQPSKEGKSSTPAEPTAGEILAAVNKIGGRVTKLEQTRKSPQATGVAKEKKGFTFDYPDPEDPNKDVQELQQREELIAVERGITHLLRDEKYKDLLNQDETLSEILQSNPLALLTEDPIDAQDALAKITEVLDKKVETLMKKQEKAKKEKGEEGKETKPAPKAGPATTPESGTGTTPTGESGEQKKQIKSVEDVGKGLAGKISADPRLRAGVRKE